MSVASLVIIAVFYGLVLGVGWWASRKAGKETKADDLFLAGRRLPVWVGIITMTATWVGGGYINGTAEATYASGLIWTQAPWGYALSLLIGGLFFAGPMRRQGHTTLLDPFAKRYGHKVAGMLFIPALIGEIFWSAAILTALGFTFSTILGIDVKTAIIVSSLVAVGYTFMGGLWAVAYTDVIQMAFIVLGLGLAIPFAVDAAGGWEAIYATYQSKFGAGAQLWPTVGSGWSGFWESVGTSPWYWSDLALLLIFGGIPWGVYFQRVLACPTAKQAQGLSYAAAVLCFLMAGPPIIIGALATNAPWAATAAGTAPEGAVVLPAVLHYLTPSWVAAPGLGAVAAAVMSSVDSSILSASSMFAWNIVRPLTGMSEGKGLVWTTKAAIALVGTAATALALTVQSVYALWFLCADLVYVALFPQLVLALYYRGATAAGATCGFLVSLGFRIGCGEPTLGLPALFPWDEHFPFRTVGMLLGLVTIFGVSALTGSKAETEEGALRGGMTPQPSH